MFKNKKSSPDFLGHNQKEIKTNNHPEAFSGRLVIF